MSMQDKIIGLVWRHNINDYEIMLNQFEDADQDKLQDIYDRYADGGSGERGDKNLTLDTCDVDYWETEWAKEDMEKKRLELAHELYVIGYSETGILNDMGTDPDELMTEKEIADSLKSVKNTSYLLETFIQFCDGSQEEEDHKKFFDASMKIVHYMENMKGEN